METNTSCIVENSFLFWNWKSVEHTYIMYSVSKFMRSSTTFHIRWICEKCGAEKEQHFVTQDQLLLKGIPMEILKTIDDFNYYYPEREGKNLKF